MGRIEPPGYNHMEHPSRFPEMAGSRSGAYHLTDEQILEKDRLDKERKEKQKSLENLSKEESMTLLKQLFKDEGVSSTWRWDDSFRVIKSHQNYTYVKLSMHEKKQAFQEFLKEIKEEEREMEKIKKNRQRAIFIRLIQDCQESGRIKLTKHTKFYTV